MCPRCRKTYKVLHRCLDCARACCAECSFRRLCMDCYVAKNGDRELELYVLEKEHVITGTPGIGSPGLVR